MKRRHRRSSIQRVQPEPFALSPRANLDVGHRPHLIRHRRYDPRHVVLLSQRTSLTIGPSRPINGPAISSARMVWPSRRAVNAILSLLRATKGQTPHAGGFGRPSGRRSAPILVVFTGSPTLSGHEHHASRRRSPAGVEAPRSRMEGGERHVSEPMLTIYNHYTAACGIPPAVSNESAALHIGYFANPLRRTVDLHVQSRDARGDPPGRGRRLGSARTLSMTGRVDGVILAPEEPAWLQACWRTAAA